MKIAVPDIVKYNDLDCTGCIQLDPANSDDHIALSVTKKHGGGFVILSHQEARRLAWQIERLLAWDRSRQGSPRQWFMGVKDMLRRRPEWFGRSSHHNARSET